MYFNVAKSIGPWASWLRRGFDLYLMATDKLYGDMDDVFMRSLFCYLFAGELGYEVAQSNAGYILRSKFSALMVQSISEQSNQKSLPVPFYLFDVGQSSQINLRNLQFRADAMSGIIHGYSESYFHLGNCFFTGKCGLTARNYESAIYYYQLASYSNNCMATVYLGVMYHFNIGVSDRDEESNRVRANRYYAEALSSGNIDSAQIKTMIQVLQKMLSWKKSYSFSLFNSFHYTFDYVVKTLWVG